MTDDFTGKWCYSLDGEGYLGKFDTEKDAHGAAIDEIEADSDSGEREYFIARCRHPIKELKGREDNFGRRVLETLDEWLMDYTPSDGEEILSFTDQEAKELGGLIFDFAKSRGKVQYYGVTDSVRHTHVVGKAEGQNA